MKKLLTGLLVFALFLVACQKSEKERFIDAASETACMVFESPDLSALSADELKKKTEEIFAKYDFDVKNEKAMNEIQAKYENDAEVEAAVTRAIEGCAGDILNAVEELGGQVEKTEEVSKPVEPVIDDTKKNE